ncbi:MULTISPECIES: Lrp/AsnC family transcriptional regulator [Asticcacaulis]|uniref:Lrp/AsnC family transcriptional regulator n=1 Tax=Asticcacaulis TaxID=76890 RepID=UPI001AE6FB2C|nr:MULTISPECIES: Lrp/AsnC family transcriptional regulator [Asticcacaulis]MBP2158508.1 Lrp/AsnC family transcriptional regulator [Asticcacaulis solisilvae]MDR6799554.1 Lrp/AsnC family transcriptional regulator [Asticcacaulis sp. BE141]
MLDDRDRRLLAWLQRDADMPLSDLAERVHLSPSACSRRVARLKEEGYIRRSVAVLDRDKMQVPTTVFVMIKMAQHKADWPDRFRESLSDIAEIVEAHRLAGSLDYLLKIVVGNMAHYDTVYKRIISRIELLDVSSCISMETLKDDPALPTAYA